MTNKNACYKSFGEPIKKGIIDALRGEEPLTVISVAQKTDLCWRTAKKRLLELVDENKVVIRKVGKLKLFFLSPELKKEDTK